MSASAPTKKPLQGEKFWPGDGTDNWKRVYEVETSDGPLFRVLSFTQSEHVIRWHYRHNRWEESIGL